MQTLATVSMTTPKGHTSTWHFAKCTTGWYAYGGCHKPLVKKLAGIKELRALYRNYLNYGFQVVGKPDDTFVRFQAPIADPWESQLPVDMQLDLQALSA